jgi:uncharacterized membrane protein YjgN (DUF898 family)
MPPVIRGIVFAVLGVLLVFKLVRAARFGTVSSRGMTFDFASSPIWFIFGVGCYVLLLIFCGAEILSVFGVMPDPTITVKAYLTGS